MFGKNLRPQGGLYDHGIMNASDAIETLYLSDSVKKENQMQSTNTVNLLHPHQLGFTTVGVTVCAVIRIGGGPLSDLGVQLPHICPVIYKRPSSGTGGQLSAICAVCGRSGN